MAVLADIAGLSLADEQLDSPFATYQSVDPAAVNPSPSSFSALTSTNAYGEYYSPPGADEQQQTIPNDNDSGEGHATRTACNPCKKNHTKCSGEMPICMQCQRRKIQCSYSPQKKRGPKTGQVKSLQEEVKQLSEVVEAQRKQLTLLQSAQNDERGKRRRPIENALTAPDPEVRPDLVMPGFVNEYIRLFEEYIEPGCVVRDPNQARTSLDSIKLLMQYSPTDPDPFRARQLLGMYTMLASGAQVFGNPVHAQEFMSRARSAAQTLFDISDLHVAAGFDRISYFYIGLGDLDKARLYNGVALRMLENLDTPIQHPVHLSVLLGRGLLVKTIDERVALSHQLRNSGSVHGEMLGLTLALKVKLHMYRSGEPMNLPEVLPILQRADEILKQRVLPERRQQTTKAMMKGLKAGVYYAAGQLALAEQHADVATRLAKAVGSNGQYATFCVAVGIEWAAEVHHNRGKVEQLREDCNILEVIAARFPIMTEVSRRYTQMLTALTQVPSSASSAPQVPVSVEMLAPEAFLLPDNLGDITKMGGSEGSLERLLTALEEPPVLELPKELV